ncbi:trypsin-like peptidase domain-containing protein [Streptomyces ardesiacus]|uniref:trypsin-like peptidase domain-containing protein n=1 Tax=Streptomyces ardesiacus TaxID=285564 RepID=UPI00201EA4CD|nr:trypsin-like peptidase domain-containing protein [Streptomyces ardesiacus]MCL7365255.1 trypsin-like peptidase domain-containing protein [Streptomyces ardesiacus]
MNEGKPTKAKWWSRPRSSEDAPDGDFELERPRPARPAAAGTDTGADAALDDRRAETGDFELERPVAPRAADEGDYELDRPERKEPADAPPPPRAGTGTPAGPAGETGGPEPEESGPAPAADDAPAAERPKPLHEPDPYSTPPYGEPGPWAPAPPVQHPAATPAHGTVTAPHAPAVPAPATAPAASPPPGAAPDPAFAEAPPPIPGAGQGRHPAAPVPPYATAAHFAAPTAAPAAAPTAAPTAAPAAPPTAAPAAPPASDPAAAPASDPWAGPTAPPSGADPAADPWGRYDPWAASAVRHHEAADRTPTQRRRRRVRTLVGGSLLIALVSGGLGGAVGAYLERNGGVGTVELPQAAPEAAERAPDSVAGIAARALPSVVTLHVSGSEASGTGTGFVLDDRGHILTNNHVVEPAGSGGEITVTFNSGDTAEGTVVGRDSGYDLAVVKVKGVKGLTPMPLGNSDSVRVGDPVVAIGAPFDLAGTVTSGIISAKERPITAGGEEGDGSDVSYVDALQTDAPINPGNSGGPLLDGAGRAVGINSAIRSADSGSAESDGGQAGSIGLGFAIPINQGKRVAEELINTGRATHPVIGITLDMGYAGDGARVGAKGSDGGAAVTPGGPGAKAGIKPGDVITAVDGQRVHSGEELIVKTRAHRPGDRLELTLERDGKETKVSLVLGSAGGS